MSDLIDRQDAIDAIRNIKAITGTSDDEILLVDKAQAQKELMMLPSAQPELSNNSPKLDNKNGELISRQDAIEAINAYLGLSAVSRTIQNMTSIQEILEKLPAVDTDLSTFSDKLWKIAYERGKAEGRKKGKWLRSGSAIFPCECDQCGDTTERNTPFCPNCGADMKEGEEDG